MLITFLIVMTFDSFFLILCHIFVALKLFNDEKTALFNEYFIFFLFFGFFSNGSR